MKLPRLALIAALVAGCATTPDGPRPTRGCPEGNSSARQLVENLLIDAREDPDFTRESGLQGLHPEDLRPLEGPGDTAVCTKIRETVFHYTLVLDQRFRIVGRVIGGSAAPR